MTTKMDNGKFRSEEPTWAFGSLNILNIGYLIIWFKVTAHWTGQITTEVLICISVLSMVYK